MRRLYLVFIPLLLLLFATCKKVTKNVNSEKMFSLIFADSSKAPIDQCYDKVWAKGKGDLGNCSSYQEGLKLPLSIKYDSTTYYFSASNRMDTLTITYKRTIKPQSDEFEVMYDILELKGSFKKISRKCVSGLTPICDGDKAYLSAVVYQ